MSYNDHCNVDVLLGKTLTSIKEQGDELWFTTTDGDVYKMYHAQDCCESVYIESITGDLEDLVGEPILLAEEVENIFDIIKALDAKVEDSDDSHTWTFYKFATRKGYVDIRWYGSSNGYYSESVDFEKVKNGNMDNE